MAHDINDFQTDVLEESRKQPVLVDFWAPWCGPCRTLGPVLEKLETEGGWKLAKVNTDQHPELSGQYGIKGIPAVKLFVDGEVVDEFTGALPEYAVRQWLEKAIPSESKDRVKEAEDYLDGGMIAEARALLETVVIDQPTNAQASALLARILVFDEPERALALADTGMNGEPRHVQVCAAVRTIAEVLQKSPDELPDEPGMEAYVAALDALRLQEFDGAITRFISVLQTNRYFDNDGARKAGVAVFTLLGPDAEVTRKHRRTFDMWLY